MGNQISSSKSKVQSNKVLNILPPKDWIPKNHSILNTKYTVNKKLGSGSFGNVHLCTKKSTGETYAIKFENKVQERQLEYEKKVYDILEGLPGIPQVYEFGETNFRQFLIMDRLGKNLNELLYYCGKKFSLKTVLMIADQLLCRLEHIHSKSFVYRDMKPENFVIGTGKNRNQIYSIDFGLTKLYRDFWTHKPNKYKNRISLVGTSRYCSINTHLGIDQSRRDDLESLAYMLIYFLKGDLPWKSLKLSSKTLLNDQICNLKVLTKSTDLCKGLPDEFLQFLRYCKTLEYQQKPNYSKLRQNFRKLFLQRGYVYDYKFDWVVKKEEEINVMKKLEKLQRVVKKNKSNKEEINYTKQEKEWVRKLFKNATTKNEFISTGNDLKVQEKELNRDKRESQSSDNSEDNETNEDNQDNGYTEEAEETENESPNELETKKKELKIEKKMIKKIKKYKNITKKVNNYHNNHLKLLIEEILNHTSKKIFANREKIFSSFVNEKEREKKNKHISLYFIRQEEIFRNQHRYIYLKMKKTEKLLQKQPQIETQRIQKQFRLVQTHFKDKLNFEQILILYNHFKELKFMIKQRKIFIQNDSNQINLQIQKLTLSSKQLSKLKNNQLKNEINQTAQKFIEKKISIFDQIKKLAIIQEDPILKKKIKKIEKRVKKTLKGKHLVKVFDEINNFLIEVQGLLNERNN
ncbi:ck1 family protein kinase [Anaeramoeba flamelloides]|uniref:non-specific serine/threonine protein kinase n=1 Tax=Anaeramoeba flamelloides TaxID=1746091 RepID=A0AAV7ZC32_9EUKA|nr:ck1 family protein kinase [Anaeramoeba flamelloides]